MKNTQVEGGYTGRTDFSEQILADLIAQGLTSPKLLAQFKEITQKERPAVQKLIDEADEMAKTDSGKLAFSKLFESEKV